MRQLLEALKSDIDEARKSVELFDKLENGKKKIKLLTRRNKIPKDATVAPLSTKESTMLHSLEKERKQMMSLRDAVKDRTKKMDEDMTKLRSALKRDSQNYYYAIEQHWKQHGKSKAAYHGSNRFNKLTNDWNEL